MSISGQLPNPSFRQYEFSIQSPSVMRTVNTLQTDAKAIAAFDKVRLIDKSVRTFTGPELIYRNPGGVAMKFDKAQVDRGDWRMETAFSFQYERLDEPRR
jgi:hypothetical protein